MQHGKRADHSFSFLEGSFTLNVSVQHVVSFGAEWALGPFHSHTQLFLLTGRTGRKATPPKLQCIPSWSVAGALGGLQLAREGGPQAPWS